MRLAFASALSGMLVFGCGTSATTTAGTSSETTPPPNSDTTSAADASVIVDASSGSSADSGPWSAPPDASAEAASTVAAACSKAGTFTLYAIPPPSPLDWSSPNALLTTAATSAAAGEALVTAGKVGLSHEIGHVNLEVDCGADSVPLTGQTGGGDEWQSGGDGFGVVFRNFPGSLTESGADQQAMVNDIALRQANGYLTRITFAINDEMCQRLKSFHDEYVAKMAYLNYDGLFRARRFEGAGCAIFGAGFVDVGGLLHRSAFTPIWARSVLVGSARFADFLGQGYYPYGSNLVAPDPSGTILMWPKGVDVPASTLAPVILGSSTLDAWSGPEDTPFNLAGLTGEMASAVPFSLYDPQLMAAWAEGVWAQAQQNGTAASLGAVWTAGQVGGAHEITYDASCVAPQTIPFDADNDNLFLDSDAP